MGPKRTVLPTSTSCIRSSRSSSTKPTLQHLSTLNKLYVLFPLSYPVEDINELVLMIMTANHSRVRPPPFPNDIPVIPLPRLSLSKLLSRDEKKSEALFAAAINHGFFLVDLAELEDGDVLMAGVDNAFSMGHSFFDQDVNEKGKYGLKPGNIGLAFLCVNPLRASKTDQLLATSQPEPLALPTGNATWWKSAA